MINYSPNCKEGDTITNSSLFCVGKYQEEFNNIVNIDLPVGEIYQSQGLITHINKRHPLLSNYISNIPDIISSPDYIGTNPKEPDSIELVKIYSDNILVAVKLDKKENYLYVASLYDISNAKLSKRIESGRLKIFVDKST